MGNKRKSERLILSEISLWILLKFLLLCLKIHCIKMHQDCTMFMWLCFVVGDEVRDDRTRI